MQESKRTYRRTDTPLRRAWPSGREKRRIKRRLRKSKEGSRQGTEELWKCLGGIWNEVSQVPEWTGGDTCFESGRWAALSGLWFQRTSTDCSLEWWGADAGGSGTCKSWKG